MVIDIPQERSMVFIDKHFGEDTCHFPLFDFVQPLSVDWMHVLYLVMFLGACGIFLGFMFRVSCLSFMVTYWYVFLLEKARWNNHSYLYGLFSVMLLMSNANCYWWVKNFFFIKNNFPGFKDISRWVLIDILDCHWINILIDISINIWIDTWLTLDWHMINISINTWSTLNLQLVNSWSTVDRIIRINNTQHSLACLGN